MTYPILYAIISGTLYILAPREYNLPFCLGCCILYILLAFSCIKSERFISKNHISFNFLFFVILWICTFIVPLFLDDVLYTLPLSYNKYINKATALVVLAVAMYHLGWQISIRKSRGLSNKDLRKPRLNKTIVNWLNTLCIISTIGFVIILSTFLKTVKDSNDIQEDVFILTAIQSFLPLSLLCSTIFNQRKTKNIVSYFRFNKVPLLCILFVVLASLYIGDRAMPISLIIAVVFLYSQYISNIPYKLLVLIGAVLCLSMYLIAATRKSDNSIRSGGMDAMIVTSQSTLQGLETSFELVSDFTPATQTLYLCMNWKEVNNDYFYPSRLALISVSPFPFLPSTLSMLLYNKTMREMSSAYVVTRHYSNNVNYMREGSGLGTHVVGDIFISWGIIGVVIAFFFFGKIVASSQFRGQYNIYFAIVYLMLMCDAAYIPRATLYCSLRPIVFAALVYYMCSSSSKRLLRL